MDVNGSSRKRHVKSVTRARLLSALRHAPPFSNSGTANDDLTEEDIFWSEDLAAEDRRFAKENGLRRFSSSSNHRKVYGSTERFTFLAAALPDLGQNHAVFNHKASITSDPASSPQMIPRRAPDRIRYRSSVSLTKSTESFTFLAAALPDLEQNHAVFNHKASVTSDPASSPQMIPRRGPDRIRYRSSVSMTKSTENYHQSLPVRVPKGRTRRREFFEIEVEDEEGDGEKLPPHEVVARTWQRSPYSRNAAFSVLEGAGRTLKGRDLHRVRNAVWQQTGFLD